MASAGGHLCGNCAYLGLLQRCSCPHIHTLHRPPDGMLATGAKRAVHNVYAELACACAGMETARSASGPKPASQGVGNGGGEPGQSQLPSDLIDFLSRELEDCLSPLGESHSCFEARQARALI